VKSVKTAASTKSGDTTPKSKVATRARANTHTAPLQAIATPPARAVTGGVDAGTTETATAVKLTRAAWKKANPVKKTRTAKTATTKTKLLASIGSRTVLTEKYNELVAEKIERTATALAQSTLEASTPPSVNDGSSGDGNDSAGGSKWGLRRESYDDDDESFPLNGGDRDSLALVSGRQLSTAQPIIVPARNFLAESYDVHGGRDVYGKRGGGNQHVHGNLQKIVNKATAHLQGAPLYIALPDDGEQDGIIRNIVAFRSDSVARRSDRVVGGSRWGVRRDSTHDDDDDDYADYYTRASTSTSNAAGADLTLRGITRRAANATADTLCKNNVAVTAGGETCANTDTPLSVPSRGGVMRRYTLGSESGKLKRGDGKFWRSKATEALLNRRIMSTEGLDDLFTLVLDVERELQPLNISSAWTRMAKLMRAGGGVTLVTSPEHLHAVDVLVNLATNNASHMGARQVTSTLWAMARASDLDVVVNVSAVQAMIDAAIQVASGMTSMEVANVTWALGMFANTGVVEVSSMDRGLVDLAARAEELEGRSTPIDKLTMSHGLAMIAFARERTDETPERHTGETGAAAAVKTVRSRWIADVSSAPHDSQPATAVVVNGEPGNPSPYSVSTGEELSMGVDDGPRRTRSVANASESDGLVAITRRGAGTAHEVAAAAAAAPPAPLPAPVPYKIWSKALRRAGDVREVLAVVRQAHQSWSTEDVIGVWRKLGKQIASQNKKLEHGSRGDAFTECEVESIQLLMKALREPKFSDATRVSQTLDAFGMMSDLGVTVDDEAVQNLSDGTRRLADTMKFSLAHTTLLALGKLVGNVGLTTALDPATVQALSDRLTPSYDGEVRGNRAVTATVCKALGAYGSLVAGGVYVDPEALRIVIDATARTASTARKMSMVSINHALEGLAVMASKGEAVIASDNAVRAVSGAVMRLPSEGDLVSPLDAARAVTALETLANNGLRVNERVLRSLSRESRASRAGS